MTTTISYYELVGDWEDINVTIAALLDAQWDDTNTNSKTPVIRDAGDAFTSKRTHAPRRSNLVDTITVNEVGEAPDSENRSSGYAVTGINTILDIRVISDSFIKAKAYVREINRILVALHPNSGVRLKKSNGTENSVILYFQDPLPTWTPEPIVKKSLHAGVVEWSGVLIVQWAMKATD